MPLVDDIAGLRRILTRSRVIAVVGLSAQWFRPSYFAAKYMQDHGYRIIPVNPSYPEVLGEKCYPSVAAIPDPSTSSTASASTARWCPSRTRPSPTARRSCGCSSGSTTRRRRAIATDAGLDVVVDRCVKIEHARILGGLNWAGVNTGVDLVPARRLGRRRFVARIERSETRGNHPRDRAPRVSLRSTRATNPATISFFPWLTANSASTRCACTRADPRRGDRRARGADLPDHVVRLRQRRPCGEPVQPADLRQRLLADLQSDGRRVRGARRGAGRRPRRAGRVDRHGRADARTAHAVPRRATTSSPRARSTAAATRSSR